MSPAAKTPSREDMKFGGGDVAALVEREAELVNQPILDGTEETHGQQDEIDVEGELGAGDGFEFGWRADADGVNLLDLAAGVAGEFDTVDGPIADATLFMGALDAQLQGPQRPGRGCGALFGRLGHDLKLVNAFCALAMAGAEAVCAGVAAADDEDALAGGEDGARGRAIDSRSASSVSPSLRRFCWGRNSMAK